MRQLFNSQLPKDVRDLIDTLVSDIQTLKTQLEEVKQLMAISEADFTLLQNKVTEIEGNLTTLTQTVSGIQTSVGELATADTTIIQDLGNLQDQDEALATSITSLQQADTDTANVLTAVLNRLTAIETKHLTMAVRDLTLPYTQVTENITLPVTDEYESVITWSSSHPEYISDLGVVTRPAYEIGNVFVTLTALIEYGEQFDTKDFVIEVIALEAPTEPEPTV